MEWLAEALWKPLIDDRLLFVPFLYLLAERRF